MSFVPFNACSDDGPSLEAACICSSVISSSEKLKHQQHTGIGCVTQLDQRTYFQDVDHPATRKVNEYYCAQMERTKQSCSDSIIILDQLKKNSLESL